MGKKIPTVPGQDHSCLRTGRKDHEVTKPKSLRMRLHEANRPPEYLQAYPADEMDAWLDYLDFTINGYKFGQQGDANLIEAIKAENAELQALFDMQWKRMRTAEKLWCDAHPDRKNIRPDLGALIQWLMDERGRSLNNFVQVLSLLDGAEDVIELYGYKAEYPAQKKWAMDWLAQARGFFASYQKSKEAAQ